MKNLLVLLSLISGLAVAQSRPTNWQKVSYHAETNLEIFVDSSTMNMELLNGSYVGTANFLLVSPKQFTVKYKGQDVKAISLVKLIVADCTAGRVAAVADMYFDHARPNTNSEPVKIQQYAPGEMLGVMEKSNLVVATICSQKV